MGWRRLGGIGFTALGIALLQGCAAILPAYDSREFCRVAVEEKFDSITVEPNELRRRGAAELVAEGALWGASLDPRGRGDFLSPGPHPFLWVPGIILGAVLNLKMLEYCRAELLRVPNAEADFKKLIETVDAAPLKRFVLAELDAHRPACARVRRDETITAPPDAVIEITKFAVVLGCGGRKQTYGAQLEWRVLKQPSAAASRVHGPKSTEYKQVSSVGVEDWLARPDLARLEIERVMAKIAYWLVKELTGYYGANWSPPTLHVPFPAEESPTPGGNADG